MCFSLSRSPKAPVLVRVLAGAGLAALGTLIVPGPASALRFPQLTLTSPETVKQTPASCAPMHSQPYRPQVLGEVFHRVASAREVLPIVIFDLDDTLFHMGFRQKIFFGDFFALPGNGFAFPTEAARLAKMPWQEFCLNWKDSVAKAGATGNAEFSAAFSRFWNSLTDYKLANEMPIAGAVRYLQTLHAAGAKIVYLTARRHAIAGRGTLLGLRNSGFPVPDPRDPRSPVLLMRDQPGRAGPEPQSDVEFKRILAAGINRRGQRVLAVFENEPGNLNGMLEVLPGALGVFVDTRHSFLHGMPAAHVAWIADYR